MDNKFGELQSILDSMQNDLDKFYNRGQDSAGTRIRKELNKIRKLSAEIRKEIQEERSLRINKKFSVSGDSDSLSNIKNRTDGTGGKDATNSSEMSDK